MVKIAPSILSANFAKLGEEIAEVKQVSDYIHIDVMDGHFVPNITIGPLIVSAVRSVTSLPLDVHLMIEEPERYIKDFASAGADILSVHVETSQHLHRTVQLIKDQGIKAGVALNPATPISAIQHVIRDIDLVLLMTVNPGFGGQVFIPSVVPKIREAAAIANENEWTIDIEVDGGINSETASICTEAGANVLVAGTAIFNEQDRRKAIETIRRSVSHQ